MATIEEIGRLARDSQVIKRAVNTSMTSNKAVPSKKAASDWFFEHMGVMDGQTNPQTTEGTTIDRYSRLHLQKTASSYFAAEGAAEASTKIGPDTVKPTALPTEGFAARIAETAQTARTNISQVLKPISSSTGSTLGTNTLMTTSPLGSPQAISHSMAALSNSVNPSFTQKLDSTLKKYKVDGLTHMPGKMMGSIQHLANAASKLLSVPLEFMSDMYRGVMKLAKSIAKIADSIITMVTKFFIGPGGLMDSLMGSGLVKGFLSIVKQIGAKALTLVQSFGGANLIGSLTGSLGNFASMGSKFLSNPMALAQSYLPQMPGGLGGLVGSLGGGLGGLAGSFGGLAGGLGGGGLGGAIGGLGGGLGGAIGGLTGSLGGGLGGLAGGLGGKLGGLAGSLGGGLGGGLGGAIGGLTSSFGGGLGGIAGSLGSSLGGGLGGMAGGLGGLTGSLGGGLGGLAGGLGGLTGGLGGGINNAIGSTISGFGGGKALGGGGIGGALTGLAGSVGGSLGGLGGGAIGGITGMLGSFKGGGGMVGNLTGAFGGNIGGIASGVASALMSGGGGGIFSKITALAGNLSSMTDPSRIMSMLVPPQLGSQLGGLSKAPGLGFQGNLGYSVGNKFDAVKGMAMQGALSTLGGQAGILAPLLGLATSKPNLTDKAANGPLAATECSFSPGQIAAHGHIQETDSSARAIFFQKGEFADQRKI